MESQQNKLPNTNNPSNSEEDFKKLWNVIKNGSENITKFFNTVTENLPKELDQDMMKIGESLTRCTELIDPENISSIIEEVRKAKNTQPNTSQSNNVDTLVRKYKRAVNVMKEVEKTVSELDEESRNGFWMKYHDIKLPENTSVASEENVNEREKIRELEEKYNSLVNEIRSLNKKNN